MEAKGLKSERSCDDKAEGVVEVLRVEGRGCGVRKAGNF